MVGRFLLGICIVLACTLSATVARAESVLQLYLEGSTYNSTTESWEVMSTGGTLRLWTIGAVGQVGTIRDVKLSAAYSASAGDQNSVQIALTPSTTGGLGGFVDPSTPQTPTFVQFGAEGSTPKLSDGSDLPTHGIYGAGTVWQEFALGDFTLKDSPLADFIDSFPTPPGNWSWNDSKKAQINVYEISVSTVNNAPVTLHFDLYDTIVATNHAKFAPFSHDGDGTGGGGGPGPGPLPAVAPEPSSLAMLLLGSLPLGMAWFRRRNRDDGCRLVSSSQDNATPGH